MTNAIIYVNAFNQTQEVQQGLLDYRPDGAIETTDLDLNVDLLTSDARTLFQYKALGDDVDAETAIAKYTQGTLLNVSGDAGFDAMGGTASQLDFMQRLAGAVFGSKSAMDLFSNEYQVAGDYQTAMTNMISNVNGITTGTAQHEDSDPYEPGHVHDEPGATNLEPGSGGSTSVGGAGAMDVLLGLLNQDKARFHASDEPGMEPGADFVPMPLKAGDKLELKFTVSSNQNQLDVKGQAITAVEQKIRVQITLV